MHSRTGSALSKVTQRRPPPHGEGVGGPGERPVDGGGRRFEPLGPGVDPHVGVEQVVVRDFHDTGGGAGGVHGRGDGGSPGVQMVVGLLLEPLADDSVEGDGQDDHQEGGGGDGDQGESPAQGVRPRTVRE